MLGAGPLASFAWPGAPAEPVGVGRFFKETRQMPRQEVPFSGDLLVVQRCAVSFFGVAKDASRPQGFAKFLCRIFPAKLHVHNRGPLGADIAPPLPFFVPLCISVPCAIIHHSSFITHHSSSGASHKCPF